MKYAQSLSINNDEWQGRAPPEFPPPWASAWGDDTYGLWAELCLNKVVQRLRWIEPGEFMMGSPKNESTRMDWEGPMHEVKISRGFWLADTACTQALWLAMMDENPSYFHPDHGGSLAHPVERISYLDVQRFLKTMQSALPSAQVSLPTEAEWEYACRSGTRTPFHFGETISSDSVNFDGNHLLGDAKKGEYRERTLAVKALPANSWGLWQMHGNVWEWCADEWRDYDAHPVVNPGLLEAITSMEAYVSNYRVIRGGSWFSDATEARSANRFRFLYRECGHHLGFRFALRSSHTESKQAEFF